MPNTVIVVLGRLHSAISGLNLARRIYLLPCLSVETLQLAEFPSKE
jgi:hypothetical protein